MAYARDDDRFYDSLASSGKDYQKYQDRVAEDQAATTRELGQMYGQALPNTIGAAMKGADWRQKREAEDQKMDLNRDYMDMAQAKEGRDVQKFAEDQTDWTDKDTQRMSQREFEAAPADEGYAKMAGVEYQPGMTHKQVQLAAEANALGAADRKLTAEGARSKAEIEAANTRAAASQTGENTRQDKLLAFDREKNAADNATKMAEYAHPKLKPVSSEVVSKLSAADSAEDSLKSLEKEWNEKASGKFAGVTQFVGNTDASRYDDAANVNAQTIGLFLEDGKLNEADLPRYKAMLPTPTDSAERAQEKLTRLSVKIANKKKREVDGLRATGYDVGQLKADGQGHQFKMGRQDDATAYADDANMELSPADLQAKMLHRGKLKPLHQMTKEEKEAELMQWQAGP